MNPALTVRTQPPYPVYIGKDLFADSRFLGRHIHGSERLVVITDETVKELYGQTLEASLARFSPLFISFPAGEEHKNRECKAFIEDSMLAAGVNRDACILAVGGGVVTDLAGFVAATYCRGIPAVYCPTTLLAMVDAGVGGKTGVNTPYGKNLIGAFHQPRAVIMDVALLATLPEKELAEGLAEMLKHAVLEGETNLELFLQAGAKRHDLGWLLEDTDRLIGMLVQSVKTKARHVELDEHDHGVRQLLNFGHTLGHAVEQLSNYTISHGHAVAIGMLVESRLCMQLGLMPEEAFDTIAAALPLCGFDLHTSWLQDAESVLSALHLDKKAKSAAVRFVLLHGPGKPCSGYVGEVSPEALFTALAWYNNV